MSAEKDYKIEEYYGLKPTAFPILARLEVREVFDLDAIPSEFQVEIELRPNGNTTGQRLLLTFRGVRDLRLNQPSLSTFHLPLIEIVSIQDRQWQNLKYRVKESEEETLSFLCRDFAALIKNG